MKKFQIHLDALIVILLLLVASLFGNWYQNRQYDALFIEKIDLEWRLQNAETRLKFITGQSERTSAVE